MISRLNWQALYVLIAYPLFLIFLTWSYLSNNSLSSFAILCFVLGYYVTNISVGVGLHRLWAHNSFKVNKYVEFVLIMFSAAALQKPALIWSSDHHKHHTYTDQDKDPHSPNKFRNPILGFLWSHVLWMLFKPTTGVEKVEMVTLKKLGRNKLVMWQFKHYWKIVFFMHIVPPLLFGYFFGGNGIETAYVAFLFIGLGRALQQEMTFCVNSACHFWGKVRYYRGSAKDIWWLAPFLLGENWHNFHHAFPSDYRNGHKLYHFDVHKWIIYGLYKLGLAWDLDCTPRVRIEAKINETKEQTAKDMKLKWFDLTGQCEELIALLTNAIHSGSGKAMNVVSSVDLQITSIRSALDKIVDQSRVFLKNPELSSQQIFDRAYAEFKRVQALAHKQLHS